MANYWNKNGGAFPGHQSAIGYITIRRLRAVSLVDKSCGGSTELRAPSSVSPS